MTTTRVAILDLGVAPDGVSSRPGSWRLAHLVGCAVGRRSPARGSIVDADALVVFDFGTGRDGMPAKSNEQLARVALRFGTVPLLAQTEAAWLMATTGRVVIDIEALARRHHDCDERYVDTTSAARAAADLLAESPLATVGVIAHPAHAARCAAICEAEGLRVVIPTQINMVDFDPASGQWWTRRRSLWVLREMAVLTHHAASGVFRRRC